CDRCRELARFGAARVKNHVGARCRQRTRHRGADAARRARDERDAAGEIERMQHSSLTLGTEAYGATEERLRRGAAKRRHIPVKIEETNATEIQGRARLLDLDRSEHGLLCQPSASKARLL